ncbi:MAG: hypothetical protein RAK18_06685 [Conexivisphaerales archaeon]|nr:hypothetical protein [Conexivisphaerales archaeon]
MSLPRNIRVLVTGAGGIGGVNFVRALRLIEEQTGVRLFIVGTDYNPHYILFPQLDVRFRTPRHSDPGFVRVLLDLVDRHGIDFLHPHPSVEARVVAENLEAIGERGVRTFLPRPSSIMPDKLAIAEALQKDGVPVPKTARIRALDDVDLAFASLGSPLWIRARTGASGRLGLKVNSPEEAKMWISFNVKQGRVSSPDEFILQEYLPGRDVAFDSLWFAGKLVTSYSRERLEYPFRHISLSGITGTPSVAKIINDDEINRIGTDAVRSLDPEPHGFFSVDMKGESDGRLRVTEVDGKWHTTAPLWGYAMAKITGRPELNLVQIYLTAGMSGEVPDVPRYDLYPGDHYMIRQMDCGVILRHGDSVWRVA